MKIRIKNKNVLSVTKNRYAFNIKIGGVNGENFMFHLYFNIENKRCYFAIHWNTDKLINLFGYNQKTVFNTLYK